MGATILILKILTLWLPCIANVIDINYTLRWQALSFAELLKGLGYFCLWNKTEHRRAELLCMTERKGFGVGGIWGYRVKKGDGSERRGAVGKRKTLWVPEYNPLS